MKIEAVVTCVNYADFLAHTLPFNRPVFDRLVVVTTPDDRTTQEVCRFWDVECIPSRAFTDRGPFCKGAGINAGLAALSRTDWLVHMDADIALPPRARRVLKGAELDPTCLYGIDRTMCRSHAEWMEFLTNPSPQHEQNVFVHPGRFPVGTRVAKDEHGGYVPIGFFQLFHANAGFSRYPEEHTDAARSDMLFALQWPRRRRLLLPELFAYHLESGSLAMGTNWSGRVSPRFGPPIVESQPVVVSATGYEVVSSS